MAAKIADVRRFALSLPKVTEEPHFHLSSFRVRGKIFATVPPDEQHLHVFVDEQERELAIVMNPKANEKLWWGKNVAGLRVTLAAAKLADVKYLLESAWRRKAPKSLQLQTGGRS
ncbi:MAG TPA: MmcQ/YjbR family DNA-binding protein [Gammaproteobacteria bacterium]|jgi:hypothetical protein